VDVHHPPHAAHIKRPKDYLVEFLMLFLAVSMGFAAENLREHLSDERKVRAYVRALAEDLQVDSAQLVSNIDRLRGDMAHADTVTRMYLEGRGTGGYPEGIGDAARFAGNSVDVVFNDRTASQLKGTGALRLIDDSLATGILQYWNNQARIAEIHDRFEALRLEHRKVGWRTFNWYAGIYRARSPDDPTYRDNHPPDVAEPGSVREFVNVTASMYNLASAMYLSALEDELRLGTRLRARITSRSGH
jgi:hypothetical protein